MKIRLLSSMTLLLFVFVGTVQAKQNDMEQLGAAVVKAAFEELEVSKSQADDLACLTNAGYVRHQGESTRFLYDVFQEQAGISLGKSNLLPVHSSPDAPLWFAFIYKKADKELLLTYVLPKNGNEAEASKAINVSVDKHQSFDPFTAVLGDKAFAVVTLANGWAESIPEDLLQGALFHDHFCSGVITGYFTARYILKHFPLHEGEKYSYIGAPGWCQDDYLLHYLNLTPGKHGYYTMEYPWYRPWQTAEGRYDQLGGIVIRFNSKENTGEAALLRFDWHEDAFREFINEPDLELDWKTQSWLHVWYNRFFLSHRNEPEYFLSVIKTKELHSKADFDALVNLGANPLAEILGPDPSWH